MNQEIVALAEYAARNIAKGFREHGEVPNFEDAYEVCDRYFHELETRGLVDNLSLYRRARAFAKFLVLIECTMSEEEN